MRNLTQKELAIKSGLTDAAIRNYELEHRKECFGFEEAMNVAHELCDKMMEDLEQLRKQLEIELMLKN